MKRFANIGVERSSGDRGGCSLGHSFGPVKGGMDIGR